MIHHRTKHERYLNADQKKTKQDELLGTKSGLIGTVLGHAVARSSWGKSGCEPKCPFQINRGLHRSSRETPLDKESLQIPTWCHVNKSKSPSSIQTQVAVVAYLDKRNEFKVHSMKHHRTIHKRYLNAAQKKTKQDENIKDVTVWKGASSKRLTSDTLQIMLLYVTEVNTCLLSRTIYTPIKTFMSSRYQI